MHIGYPTLFVQTSYVFCYCCNTKWSNSV